MCCLKPIFAVAVLATVAGCGNSEQTTASSLDQRYATALKVTNPETRAGTLVALSRDQHAAGDTSGATESLAAASRAVSEVTNPGSQARILFRIADAQTRQEGIKPAAATL